MHKGIQLERTRARLEGGNRHCMYDSWLQRGAVVLYSSTPAGHRPVRMSLGDERSKWNQVRTERRRLVDVVCATWLRSHNLNREGWRRKPQHPPASSKSSRQHGEFMTLYHGIETSGDTRCCRALEWGNLVKFEGWMHWSDLG